MARNILVINGNPDPSPDRLSGALARGYAEGAEAAGHVVNRLNVGSLRFSFLRTAKEFMTAPDEEAIVGARNAVLLADHLVIIYPLWLGSPPALLKAFMEQIARDEFFLSAGAHGMPAGRLKGRSGRVIVTMGMPAVLYRLFYRAHGAKAFNRSILKMAGIKPVATTYLGGIGVSPGPVPKLVEQLRRMGRRAK